MKAELINIMQIVFISMLFVGVIAYAFKVYKNQLRNFNKNFIKRLYSIFLEFSRHMIIKNYVSFEKYDIWRYCVHF